MVYDTNAMIQEALEMGFSHAGELNVGELTFMPEVLDMCNAETCSTYNRNWRCPPGCESIELASKRVRQYSFGLIVQTTAQLEDSFDFETMSKSYQTHEKNYAALIAKLRERYHDVLPLGANSCSVCQECTYPTSPCRFPDRAISPMESYGLLVSRVCELSGIQYYYGNNTLTYTGCYLLK